MNLRKDNKEKKPMQLMLDEISGMTGVSQEMILFCYMAYEEGYLFREIASFLKISRCRATTAYYDVKLRKEKFRPIIARLAGCGTPDFPPMEKEHQPGKKQMDIL